MSDQRTSGVPRFAHAALIVAILLVFAGLVATLVGLPSVATGLSADVNASLARSAVHSPVNATLLDFRSYDTLLEIAVLLLAVIAIRALSRGNPPAIPPDDEVLAFLARALLPVMILIAGYLLIAGLEAAGGAFQAGAILASAGVLMILSGRALPLRKYSAPVRAGLAIGLVAFLAVGISGMLVGNAFLDYPQHGAGTLVLLLEAAVTVSIALALLELFVGVLRRDGSGRGPRVTTPKQR